MSKRREEQGGLFQVGEIPMLKTLAKKYKPATRAQLEMIEAGGSRRLVHFRRLSTQVVDTEYK